ncbi:MAG: hypothetical protein HKO62_08380, partial [Gammaproteobacteria bacterium]|nr:hypothetical protein [Gammaproteobacteria bacterium]
YKAHAFLGSGSVVDGWRVKALAPAAPAPGSVQLLLGVILGATVVAGVGYGLETALGSDLSAGPALWLFLGVLAFSLLPFAAAGWSSFGAFLSAVATLAGLSLLYCLWHALFIELMPALDAPASTLRLAVAGTGFAALFVLSAALARAPSGALARTLHPHLFAGFYLDEIFTRLTFRLWPARSLPAPANSAARQAFNEV